MNSECGDCEVTQIAKPEVEGIDEMGVRGCAETGRAEDGSNSLDKPVVGEGVKTVNTSLMQYFIKRVNLAKCFRPCNSCTVSSYCASYDSYLDYSTKHRVTASSQIQVISFFMILRRKLARLRH